MAAQVAHRKEDAGTVVRHLHRFVTNGPGDLNIAHAMSAFGYDAVKWAEGQGVLAELISDDPPVEASLVSAVEWYREAASAARRALVTEPRLLSKLGLAAVGSQ
jgi:hypothetical protein